MFKQLLSMVLAISLLSTSVSAAQPEYPYLDDYEQSTVKGYDLSDYSDANEDIYEEAFVTHRSFIRIGDGGMRSFDNIIDQMYFNHFGNGFEYIQQHSTNVGTTLTYGTWVMEVLSTVTVAERSFTMTVFPDNFPFEVDEETGTWTAANDVELEEIVVAHGDVYTFFTLRNTSGRVDLSNSVDVSLVEHFDNFYNSSNRALFGMVMFVHYDEVTNTAGFVVRHSVTIEGQNKQNIHVDFAVDKIFADHNRFEKEVEIDLAYLLENHVATFIVEDHEIMARGELSIPIFDDIYLTNISFSDNTLLLQINSPISGRQRLSDRWTHVNLIDTGIEQIDWWYFWENRDFETISEEELLQMTELQMSRYLQDLYFIDVSLTDENFQTIGGRYVERAFFIPDPEMLSRIAFNVSGGYFNVVQPVNMNVPAFYSPIARGRVAAEESARITIYGAAYTIRDITVLPTEISFTVENAGVLLDILNSQWFDMHEHVRIELVYPDRISEYNTFSIGVGTEMGWGWWWDHQNHEPRKATLSFGGGAIDFNNLNAIKINGVSIELK
ncbi:MAG: hypothetical protein FWC91_11910 [Defluviitaleaceae bacterium]|nr:hypothetical protein [Defluviitaleaceae bacterium]